MSNFKTASATLIARSEGDGRIISPEETESYVARTSRLAPCYCPFHTQLATTRPRLDPQGVTSRETRRKNNWAFLSAVE